MDKPPKEHPRARTRRRPRHERSAKEQSVLFARLVDAGITPELLKEVVVFGERSGRDQTSKLHPPGYSGQRANAEAIYALRLKLRPAKWRPLNVRGQSRVATKRNKLQIVVMSGNHRTGIAGDPQPKAKHPKGEATEQSTRCNYEQLAFWKQEVPTPTGSQTWVLLVHRVHARNGQPDLVRYELSLPTKFVDGNVESWAYREIFPPIILDTPPSMGEDAQEEAEEEEEPLDIPITRR